MPEAYVVDSSVVIRWYVDQVGHEHAREVHLDMLAGRVRLETPDVCRWEVGDVLRERGVLAGRLTADEVVAALQDLDGFGLLVRQADPVAATRLAVRHGISLFDASYVALALRSGLPLLTADARLARAVAGLVSTEVLRGIAA